jgi:inner membrane transporter RhtA
VTSVRTASGARTRLTAPLIMLLSGCSMYGGATIGILLFDYLSPAAVAWLRVAASAVVLVVLIRPGRTAWSRDTMVLAGAFGIITALMNVCFYEAINRLPLGTAVAIEFLGPIAVVAYEHRTARGVAALLAALCGVILIADVRGTTHVVGIAFALAAAALWAGYIVFGKAVSLRSKPLESLAVGAAISAVITAPVLLTALDHLPHTAPVGRIVLLALALALLSSVVPYGLDQIVMRIVGRGGFALLLSLLPVAAVLIGFAVLAQRPTTEEFFGIGLVVLAVAIGDTTG